MPLKTFALAIAAALLSIAPCMAATYYVSGTANSTNADCTAAAPCTTINAAVQKASPGDSVFCLSVPISSAIIISKSVTIDCTAARGSVRDSAAGALNGAAGILINITADANDPMRTVRLQGLSITRPLSSTGTVSTSTRGIVIESADVVHIEDCAIFNVNQQGILDRRTGGQTRLYVSNTIVSNNSGPGIVAASAAPAVMVLENVKLLNNAYGIAAATGNNVMISRSTISGNTIAGVHADGGAQIAVSSSTISNNATHVNANGRVRLRDNDLQFGNVAIQGGNAVSMGQNRFGGNASPGTAPTLASGAGGDISN